MKWSRPIDYHGSRSYEPDAPAVSQVGLMTAWFSAVLRLKWRKFGGRASRSTVLLRNGDRNFSLLGAASNGKAASPGAKERFPFPGAYGMNDNLRDVASRLRHED